MRLNEIVKFNAKKCLKVVAVYIHFINLQLLHSGGNRESFVG